MSADSREADRRHSGRAIPPKLVHSVKPRPPYPRMPMHGENLMPRLERTQKVHPMTSDQRELFQQLWELERSRALGHARLYSRLAKVWTSYTNPDDDREGAIFNALRTARTMIDTDHSARREIRFAHRAVHCLPKLFARLETAEVRVPTFMRILRLTTDLSENSLALIDEDLDGWELGMNAEDLTRTLNKLVEYYQKRELIEQKLDRPAPWMESRPCRRATFLASRRSSRSGCGS